jgi:Leucine-rich repeat (LRR) protein
MFNKAVLFALLFVTALTVQAKSSLAVTTAIENLEDINLKACVQETVDNSNGTITVTDDVTQLWCDSRSIVSLSGLEQFNRLTVVSLNSNQIIDVTMMSSLHSLTRIRLGTNNIANVDAFNGMSSLTSLSLNSNNITDISVLNDLPSLKSLWL